MIATVEAAAKRRMNERTAKVINGHAPTGTRDEGREAKGVCVVLSSLSKPKATSVPWVQPRAIIYELLRLCMKYILVCSVCM